MKSSNLTVRLGALFLVFVLFVLSIDAAFANRCSERLFNFLHVLNDHDRLGLIRTIVYLYRQLLDTRRGRIRVAVRTAVSRSLAHVLRPASKFTVSPRKAGGYLFHAPRREPANSGLILIRLSTTTD